MFFAFWFGIRRYLPKKAAKGASIVLSAYFVSLSVYYFFQPAVQFPNKTVDREYTFFASIGAEYDDLKPVKFYYSQDLNFDFINHMTIYMSPNAKIYSGHDCSVPIEDYEVEPEQPVIVVATLPAKIPKEFEDKFGEPQYFEESIRDKTYMYAKIEYFPEGLEKRG
jgi:hypothetical protein